MMKKLMRKKNQKKVHQKTLMAIKNSKEPRIKRLGSRALMKQSKNMRKGWQKCRRK
jgi:hypothetical protein